MDKENMEIIQVEINLQDTTFLFDVIAQGSCGSRCVICLSSKNSVDPAFRMEGHCQWFDFSGTFTIDKSKTQGAADLYLYLLDPMTQNTSVPVQVYGEAAVAPSISITRDGSLILKADSSKRAWRLSSHIMLEYTDPQGQCISRQIPLTSMRIPLEELGMWLDDETFTFALRFHMVSGHAHIYSAPSDTITLYIAAPAINSLCLDKDMLSFTGAFLPGANIGAELCENGIPFRSGELSENHQLDLTGQRWDPEAVYTVSLWYQASFCRSLPTAPIPLLTEPPSVASLTFDGSNALIRLQKPAVYQVIWGETCSYETGSAISVPLSADTVELSMARGMVSGPKLSCKVKCPAFYPVTCGDNAFYFWGTRPDDLDTGQDITILLSDIPANAPPYDGICFRFLAKEERAGELVIKKEYYHAKKEEAQQDYQNLYQSLSLWEDALNAVKAAVFQFLPMGADDVLYYAYDYAPQDGCTGIFPGMSLLTEYTVYQNIPDTRQNEYFQKDLSGFAGSGAVRYAVVDRGGKVTLDAFCSQMNFHVPPPDAMASDNKLCGGAGIADLLYDGFAASHMRLLYPLTFPKRNSAGTLTYTDNVCLITSEKTDTLLKASAALRRRGLRVENASYQYFRGRSTVIPQIRIHVDQTPRWVSLGTVLKDILDEENADSASLYRRRSGILYPVNSPTPQMQLFMGDHIEVE